MALPVCSYVELIFLFVFNYILYLKRVNCLITQIIFRYHHMEEKGIVIKFFKRRFIFYSVCSLHLFNGYVNYLQTKTEEFHCVGQLDWIQLNSSIKSLCETF